LPLSPSDWPLDDALRLEPDWPSPCDELPRSRLELLDELLDPPWLPLDEPEVFWSRSAIVLSSEMLWTSAGLRAGSHPTSPSEHLLYFRNTNANSASAITRVRGHCPL
jgi:hypothetical protein